MSIWKLNDNTKNQINEPPLQNSLTSKDSIISFATLMGIIFVQQLYEIKPGNIFFPYWHIAFCSKHKMYSLFPSKKSPNLTIKELK